MSPRSWKEAGRCGQLRDAFDSRGDVEKAATACCDGNGERAPETTRHRSADGRLIGVWPNVPRFRFHPSAKAVDPRLQIRPVIAAGEVQADG